MGISTQKLHCRGPFALAELTSSKYEVFGTGQIRQELFIHSEEDMYNRQLCGGSHPYVERFCWNGDTDYYSVGCIKVSAAGSPSDLARLHSNWDNWSGLHGSFVLAQRLYVY